MITSEKITELAEMAMQINQHYSDYWYYLEDSMTNGVPEPVYTASVEVNYHTIDVAFMGNGGEIEKYFTFLHKRYEDLYPGEKLEKGYDPDLKAAEARLRELLKEVT